MSSRWKSSATPVFLAWMCFSIIQSCDSQKPIDRKAVLEEINARELKRIPETEILQAAEKIGDTIASAAQEAMQTALTKALKNGSVPEALSFCNANASEIMKELLPGSQMEVYRVTDRPRNPENQADSLESLVLDAYHYNQENNIALTSSVIKESEETLLYTRPIEISGGLCLNCHGKVGAQIQEEYYDSILSYYPSDQAVDYQLNQLRGMWVIKMPIKEVVQSL